MVMGDAIPAVTIVRDRDHVRKVDDDEHPAAPKDLTREAPLGDLQLEHGIPADPNLDLGLRMNHRPIDAAASIKGTKRMDQSTMLLRMRNHPPPGGVRLLLLPMLLLTAETRNMVIRIANENARNANTNDANIPIVNGAKIETEITRRSAKRAVRTNEESAVVATAIAMTIHNNINNNKFEEVSLVAKRSRCILRRQRMT